MMWREKCCWTRLAMARAAGYAGPIIDDRPSLSRRCARRQWSRNDSACLRDSAAVALDAGVGVGKARCQKRDLVATMERLGVIPLRFGHGRQPVRRREVREAGERDLGVGQPPALDQTDTKLQIGRRLLGVQRDRTLERAYGIRCCPASWRACPSAN